LKRFENFQHFNNRFDQGPFPRIKNLLENDDTELKSVPYIEKHNFLGLYEEIAISVNSRLMSENIAYYMFWYYAIRCNESDNFWLGDRIIDKDAVYWSLFKKFAERMSLLEKDLVKSKIDPSTLKF
jgi:hypothetical protein